MKGETGRPCFICFGCGMYRWKASILTGNSLLEKEKQVQIHQLFASMFFFGVCWKILWKLMAPHSSLNISFPTPTPKQQFSPQLVARWGWNPERSCWVSSSNLSLHPAAKLMRWRCFLNMKVFRSFGPLIKTYLEDGWGWACSVDVSVVTLPMVIAGKSPFRIELLNSKRPHFMVGK